MRPTSSAAEACAGAALGRRLVVSLGDAAGDGARKRFGDSADEEPKAGTISDGRMDVEPSRRSCAGAVTADTAAAMAEFNFDPGLSDAN